MSFADAWKRVQVENDALLASRAEVEHAEHKQSAAKSLYLPEVGLSASYIYLDDDVKISPDDIFDSMPAGDKVKSMFDMIGGGMGLSPAQLNKGLTSTIAERDNLTSSLTATWPIYTGGRITAAQDIAAGQVDEAQYGHKLQLISQFEHLVRYYFGAVLAKQVYTTRLSVEEGLKKHRDHAVLLEQQGQIARVERMQSEASLDKAVVERKKAGRDLEIARVALSRMLKSQELIVPADDLFLYEDLPPLEVFIKKTMNNYPALGMLDAKKEQASGVVDIEKGKYLPTVALFGNVNLYEEDDLLNKALMPDWFLGVGVSLPLVDRSGRAEQLSAAKSTVKRIDHLELQARSDLSVLVEQAYRQAQQALEEYHGLGSSVKLAEETVNLRGKAFSQGLSTSLDVVDAQLFLAGVKSQRAVAQYNYIVSLAQVLAVGCDQESFLQYQNSSTHERN
ncbi:TolC family protein [Desulfopila aestuarii]|uniref:TolC family protein n=1 Tax=Desulfopila aestuarii TaxID=231440 RepID=UPI00190E9DA0|nr:TolC family protein [Desulfopila aestuarii]